MEAFRVLPRLRAAERAVRGDGDRVPARLHVCDADGRLLVTLLRARRVGQKERGRAAQRGGQSESHAEAEGQAFVARVLLRGYVVSRVLLVHNSLSRTGGCALRAGETWSCFGVLGGGERGPFARRPLKRSCGCQV